MADFDQPSGDRKRRIDRLKQHFSIDRDVSADLKELEAAAIRRGEEFPSMSDLINRLLRAEIDRLKALNPTP